jgi:hypothetical protein
VGKTNPRPSTAPPPASGAGERTLSKTEFARHRGCTPAAVSAWVREGLPLVGDGTRARVPVERAEAWIAARVPYERGRVAQQEAADPLLRRRAEIRLQSEELDLAARQRREAEAAGTLVNRAALETALAGVMTALRTGLMRMPLAVAEETALELDVEAAVLRVALERKVRAVLEGAARSIENIDWQGR